MNILSPYPINFEQGEERKEEGEGREWKKERGENGRRGERKEAGTEEKASRQSTNHLFGST